MEITGGEGEVEGAVAVVMVPLTSQSHLAQLLHLSLLLCSRPGLAVHYASTATHVRQATSRLHPSWSSLCTSALSFHELPIPPFRSPPPDRSATKFPAHLQPMLNALENLRAPVGALLRSLSASYRRVVVVHDALNYFAAEEAAALPHVESYVFHCVSVVYQILFHHPSAALELSREHGLTIPPLESSITDKFEAFVRRNLNLSKCRSNTCSWLILPGWRLDLRRRSDHSRKTPLFPRTKSRDASSRFTASSPSALVSAAEPSLGRTPSPCKGRRRTHGFKPCVLEAVPRTASV